MRIKCSFRFWTRLYVSCWRGFRIVWYRHLTHSFSYFVSFLIRLLQHAEYVKENLTWCVMKWWDFFISKNVYVQEKKIQSLVWKTRVIGSIAASPLLLWDFNIQCVNLFVDWILIQTDLSKQSGMNVMPLCVYLNVNLSNRSIGRKIIG